MNRHTLKRLKCNVEKSVSQAEGQILSILIDNFVLLFDHQEGKNKTQDNFDSELFVIYFCICIISRLPDIWNSQKSKNCRVLVISNILHLTATSVPSHLYGLHKPCLEYPFFSHLCHICASVPNLQSLLFYTFGNHTCSFTSIITLVFLVCLLYFFWKCLTFLTNFH